MAAFDSGLSTTDALSDIASNYIPPDQKSFELAANMFSDSSNEIPDFDPISIGTGDLAFGGLPDFGLSGTGKTDSPTSEQLPVFPAKSDSAISSSNQDWLALNAFDFGIPGQSGLNLGGINLNATNNNAFNSSSVSSSQTNEIKPDTTKLDIGLTDMGMFDFGSKITAGSQTGDLNLGTAGAANTSDLKQDISGSSSSAILSNISKNILAQDQTTIDQASKAPINIASTNQNMNLGNADNANAILGSFTDFGLPPSGKADVTSSAQGSTLPVAGVDGKQNASSDLIASSASKNTDLNSRIGDLLFADKNDPFSSSGMMLAGGVDMGKPSSKYTDGIPSSIDGYFPARPAVPQKPNTGLTGDDMIKKQADDLNRGTNKINKGFSVDLDAINPGLPEVSYTQEGSTTSNSISVNVVEMGKMTVKPGADNDTLAVLGVGFKVLDKGVGAYKVGPFNELASAVQDGVSAGADGFGNFDPTKMDTGPLGDWANKAATYIGIGETKAGTIGKDNGLSTVVTINDQRTTVGAGKTRVVPYGGGNVFFIANTTAGGTYDQERINGTLSYGIIVDIPGGKQAVDLTLAATQVGLEAADKGLSAAGKLIQKGPGISKGVGAITAGVGALAGGAEDLVGGLRKLDITPRAGIASSMQAEVYVVDKNGKYLDPFDPATKFDPGNMQLVYKTPGIKVEGTAAGLVNALSDNASPGTYLIPGNINIENEVTATWEQDVVIPAKR